MISPQAKHSQLKPNPPPRQTRSPSVIVPNIHPPVLSPYRSYRLHTFSLVRDPTPAACFAFPGPVIPTFVARLSTHCLTPTKFARRIYGTRDLADSLHAL